MKILMVDDERMLLEQAKIFLEKRNEEFEIEPATSAEKALKKLEEEDYDVVVSDYQMPEMDGLEFLEELREERENDIPFIMFTGKGREEVAMKALNLGADRYLQKGGDPKSQYGVLAQAIEQEAEHRSTEKLLELTKYSIEKANREIFWITEGGKFTYANETAAERLGYSKEELEGMHIWDIDPNHGEDIRGERWEKLKEEDVLTFESEHETKEGDMYPVEITSHYLEFGGKEYEFAFAEDISERKEKERKLKETKDWLSQIVEGSSVPMFVIDEDHEVTHWNKACENLTGISKEEVVGTKDSWKAFYEEKRPLLADLVLDDASEEEIEKWYGDKFSQLSILDDAYEAEDFFPEMGEEGKWAFFTAAPLNDPEGKRVGAIETLQEITEREEQRQELKRKEKYLDHTPAYINVIDEEGNIKYHSYPSNEITGLDPSEFMGSEAIEFAHPDDREDVMEMFTKVLENPGEEYSTELRGEIEDGWVWLEVRAVNHLDDPEINGIIVSAQDISEKKEMEKELKESEEKFRSLFESSKDAVMTLKPPEWEFTSANPAAVEIFGAEDEDDFCSRLPWDYSPEKQPDGQSSKAKAKKMIDKAMDEGEAFFEWTHKRLDGEGFPATVLLSRVEVGDEAFLQATVRDITERKEAERRLKKSERRFRRIFEASPDPTFLLNKEGVFKDVNDAALKKLGYNKEEIVGKELDELPLLGEEAIEKTVENFMKRMKGEEVPPYEIEMRSKDGDVVYGEINAKAFMEEEFEGEVVIARDITERKKAQEREQLLNSLLRHDVLNKTQVIQGYLQLLGDEELSEKTREYIEKAMKANKESVNLIQKIRLLLTAQKEEQQAVEIESTIHEAVEEVEALIEDKDMDLFLECPSMECEVKGGSLLKEVFSNLMENSVNHSEGSKIKISGEVKDDEVVCTVEDDGKGIPDDKKETIFEKGYTTDEERGTGLGLFLVNMLLESYDGEIEVKDSELGGARFDVKLEKVCT